MNARQLEQSLNHQGALQYDPVEVKTQGKRKFPPKPGPSKDGFHPDELYSSQTRAKGHSRAYVSEEASEVPARPPSTRGHPDEPEAQSEYDGGGQSEKNRPNRVTSHLKGDGRNKSSKSFAKPTETTAEVDGQQRRGEGNDGKGLFRKLGKMWGDATMAYVEDDPSDDDDARSAYIRKLETERDQQEKLIDELYTNLKIETENSKKIKESANKMQYAMESKELFVGHQDSDDVIYSRFQMLVGQIKTWSVPFAKGTPWLEGEYGLEILRVAPGIADLESFERFLGTPKNMRLFVRGYVGFVMADRLFRNLSHDPVRFHGEDVWMDKNLGQPVSILEQVLFSADRKKISSREFHDWRVLTATLISRLDVSSKTGYGMEAHVTSCQMQIMSVVGHWVGQGERKVLEVELLEILFNAVRLSKTLRCQRASWSVRHIDGLPAGESVIFFDEAMMDDKHADEDSDGQQMPTANGKLVEIIVSPGLYKRGNTDGERFEFESCMARSEVKCL